jgi:hypothetical protein
MRNIVETNILVRTRVELPHGLRMATEEFREGWNFTRSVDARRLQKRILKHGWNLVRHSSGLERSGVGPTSQHAVAGALTLALRRLTAHFNAVEIEHIQLTQYPWFFLARVIVHPYRIQESATLSVSDDAVPLAVRARQRSLPLQSAARHPLFASAMPQLKEMLILS